MVWGGRVGTMSELIYLLPLLVGGVLGYVARGQWSEPKPMPPDVCLRVLADKGDIDDHVRGQLSEIVAGLTASHAKLADLRGTVSRRKASMIWSGGEYRDTERAPVTDAERVLGVADDELRRSIDRLAMTPVLLPRPKDTWG